MGGPQRFGRFARPLSGRDPGSLGVPLRYPIAFDAMSVLQWASVQAIFSTA